MANAWMEHVKAVKKANPSKSLKEVLKMAGKSYKKSGVGKKTTKTAKKTKTDKKPRRAKKGKSTKTAKKTKKRSGKKGKKSSGRK